MFLGGLIGYRFSKTETIEVERKIFVPGKDSTIIDSIPYPVYTENRINKNMQSTIDSLIARGVDTEWLEPIVEATKVRFYQDTIYGFIDGDTALRIERRDSAEGYISHRELDWKIYDRTIIDTTSITPVFKYPDFSLAGNLNAWMAGSLKGSASLQLRTKKGYLWSAGITSDKQPIIGIGKIFIER